MHGDVVWAAGAPGVEPDMQEGGTSSSKVQGPGDFGHPLVILEEKREEKLLRSLPCSRESPRHFPCGNFWPFQVSLSLSIVTH